MARGRDGWRDGRSWALASGSGMAHVMGVVGVLLAWKMEEDRIWLGRKGMGRLVRVG
ncbi:hypothetical protein ACLOJK_039699 [Asimina triloba]